MNNLPNMAGAREVPVDGKPADVPVNGKGSAKPAEKQ
jgi:hypothetical protein